MPARLRAPVSAEMCVSACSSSAAIREAVADALLEAAVRGGGARFFGVAAAADFRRRQPAAAGFPACGSGEIGRLRGSLY